MHVHLIGVAGAGMGALAGLLLRMGHRVTGCDVAFHPPMGEALRRWGVEVHDGFSPAHLDERPDLVVVGNVCRADHPEARAAFERGLEVVSMPGAIERLCLGQRASWVVVGTHGKTTTSALLLFLGERVGLSPSGLIGGVLREGGESFRWAGPDGPFVIEGDEYDSAFFEKTPKMWRYAPSAAVLTSIEHDHVDIYGSFDAYRQAFTTFVESIPPSGLLIAYAGDPEVRAVAARARCRVVYYALASDDVADLAPTWIAAPIASQGGMQPIDIFVGGTACGPVLSPLVGSHNAKNALAAIALLAESNEGRFSVNELAGHLRGFAGVERRQQWIGTADGVRVYDDFAHHPTAVRETLLALRERHPEGKLIAIFEPRSATASRRFHQEAYAEAFSSADAAILAPVARRSVPLEEQLDVEALQNALCARGVRAFAPLDLDAVEQRAETLAEAGDVIVSMSNGEFGTMPDRLLARLALRSTR